MARNAGHPAGAKKLKIFSDFDFGRQPIDWNEQAAN
jgi:hypothetical protein